MNNKSCDDQMRSGSRVVLLLIAYPVITWQVTPHFASCGGGVVGGGGGDGIAGNVQFATQGGNSQWQGTNRGGNEPHCPRDIGKTAVFVRFDGPIKTLFNSIIESCSSGCKALKKVKMTV